MQTTITQGPQAELYVKEGDNAVLTCEIQHDPDLELTVEWTMNDGTDERPIDWTIDNNRYILGGDNSLTVIDVKKVDNGVYTCNAITTFSRDSASGKVIIQSKFINTATSSNVSKTVWYYYTVHKKTCPPLLCSTSTKLLSLPTLCIWAPHQRNRLDRSEKVQRKSTCTLFLSCSRSSPPYSNRLNDFNLV